jgi:glutaredoxin 3
MSTMIELTGRRTVPQIFIGDRHVGGYDDLVELDMEGELDPLLYSQAESSRNLELIIDN